MTLLHFFYRLGGHRIVFVGACSQAIPSITLFFVPEKTLRCECHLLSDIPSVDRRADGGTIDRVITSAESCGDCCHRLQAGSDNSQRNRA